MPAISVMIKPASSACNMRCTYCFYHDVAARREQAGMGMMSYPTARAVIDSAADYADGEEIFFTFQGGEPLLAGKDFFRKRSGTLFSVSLVRQLLAGKAHVRSASGVFSAAYRSVK